MDKNTYGRQIRLATTGDRRRIVEYLLEKAKEDKRYFKAKSIARDLGMSAVSVGQNLHIMERWGGCGVVVSKRACTRPITWEVVPDESTETYIS